MRWVRGDAAPASTNGPGAGASTAATTTTTTTLTTLTPDETTPPVEEAGGRVVGFEGDILVIESAGGTWFCQVGRADASETLETEITASGASAHAAWEAYRTQRP